MSDDEGVLEWVDPPDRFQLEKKQIPRVVIELAQKPNEWGLVQKKAMPAQPSGKWNRYHKRYGTKIATRRLNGYLYVYAKMDQPAVDALNKLREEENDGE